MGNGKAKELIYMTHEHVLRWGKAGRKEGAEQRGIKRRKKWDNCNSIINKIHFSLNIFIYLFLDRGEGREKERGRRKERERNIDV